MRCKSWLVVELLIKQDHPSQRSRLPCARHLLQRVALIENTKKTSWHTIFPGTYNAPGNMTAMADRADYPYTYLYNYIYIFSSLIWLFFSFLYIFFNYYCFLFNFIAFYCILVYFTELWWMPNMVNIYSVLKRSKNLIVRPRSKCYVQIDPRSMSISQHRVSPNHVPSH